MNTVASVTAAGDRLEHLQALLKRFTEGWKRIPAVNCRNIPVRAAPFTLGQIRSGEGMTVTISVYSFVPLHATGVRSCGRAGQV